ncbi:PREDICTED: general odorant-binding protein 69a-like [Dufourea novaeangliae]|uniref:Pheromone-binding protein-related protein 1 n=1 Tax=Dufourea novaeangliae TaxID=178035 RepID=A0A154NZB2_DUFNO|nr:PREDICTED: general odorant-binding protein 69a-like [Dufourea novaeangliae]KZC04404.1 Pheromone-binding protein-related protein 1 [Dufourea novaeangliae]
MDTKHCLLFLGLVCVQAALVSAVPDWVPPEIIEMVQEDKARCMGEHGTQEAQIQEVSAGNLINDKSITCYMYCLMEAFSLVDEDANLETEMLLGILPENLQATAADIMGKCTPTSGSDNCEKIFNLAKCVQAAVPELWFII